MRTCPSKVLTALGAAPSFLPRRTIPLRTPLRRIRFRLKLTLWPALAVSTLTRLRWIDLIDVATKWPSESGPSITASPVAIRPDSITPDTTVPTKGTENTSDLRAQRDELDDVEGRETKRGH